MKPLIFIMPGNEKAGKKLIAFSKAAEGRFIIRQFPDGETLGSQPGKR